MHNPFSETPTFEISDVELAANAQNGDWQSFEELIRRHQGWIFNIAVRMVGRREDVLLKRLSQI